MRNDSNILPKNSHRSCQKMAKRKIAKNTQKYQKWDKMTQIGKIPTTAVKRSIWIFLLFAEGIEIIFSYIQLLLAILEMLIILNIFYRFCHYLLLSIFFIWSTDFPPNTKREHNWGNYPTNRLDVVSIPKQLKVFVYLQAEL